MRRVASAAELRNYLEQQTCACGQRAYGAIPVLVDRDDTLQLEVAGCASCGQPPVISVGLPADRERPAADVPQGATRAADPRVILSLAPLVAAGFPELASSEEQIWSGRRTSYDQLPTSPGWRIVEWLRGSTAHGQARMQHDDGTRALGTYIESQTASSDTLLRTLHHAARDVADLIGIRTLGGHTLMLEAEPAGVPLSTPMFPLALPVGLALFAQLAKLAAGAAEHGEVLRGLRPELVYIDRSGDRLSVTTAPRAERFASTMRESLDLGPLFPFESMYEAPELVRGERVGIAADVFSACATFVYAMQRRSPFGPPGVMPAQLAAIITGLNHDLPQLPAAIDAIVRAGLHPDPTGRPTAAELVRLLG
jgi:hypothetical protein